tara:strand:- start:227 stop:511 length:285 start_codon:yes stop_codon:yes gene_type:complete
MSIIKPKFVEIEIQQQTDPDRPAHWLTIVKYQPEAKDGVMEGAVEIKTIMMTDFDPVIRWTKDLGDKIIDMPEFGLTEGQRRMKRNTEEAVKDE